MHTKLLQLCLTLCNPMDCSLTRYSVHGILQARILEWLAVSYSKKAINFSNISYNGKPWERDVLNSSFL